MPYTYDDLFSGVCTYDDLPDEVKIEVLQSNYSDDHKAFYGSRFVPAWLETVTEWEEALINLRERRMEELAHEQETAAALNAKRMAEHREARREYRDALPMRQAFMRAQGLG